LSNETGSNYFSAFRQFLIKNINGNKSVLEIGCGRGNLLKSISTEFNLAVGIEPGIAKEISGNYKIISGFYPDDIQEGEFDMIVHFGVLEHIADPYGFLESHLDKLSDNGVVVAAVPDCSIALLEGDISVFFHEHFSYFDSTSLSNLFIKSGFSPIMIERYMGMIFISAKKQEKKDTTNNKLIELNNFKLKFDNNLSKLQNALSPFLDNDIAVYPALKGINYMTLLERTGVRLIDDSSELRDKLIPGFIRPIENFESMSQSPPKIIFITSSTYKEQIINKINQNIELKKSQIEII
jgi:SAM-dependent methyltransferase